MNLEIFLWIIGLVLSFTLAGRLHILHSWIWMAQAKVIYDSQSSANRF